MAAAEVGVCAWAALEVEVDLVMAAGVEVGVRLRTACAPSAPPPMPPITNSAAAATAARLGGRRGLFSGEGGAAGGSGGSYGNGSVTISPIMRGASLWMDDEKLRQR